VLVQLGVRCLNFTSELDLATHWKIDSPQWNLVRTLSDRRNSAAHSIHVDGTMVMSCCKRVLGELGYFQELHIALSGQKQQLSSSHT